MWQDIYNTTKDPPVKENALTHLQLLRAEEDCKQIDALAEEYRKSEWGGVRSVLANWCRRGCCGACRWIRWVMRIRCGEDGKAELNVESPLLEKQVMVDAEEVRGIGLARLDLGRRIEKQIPSHRSWKKRGFGNDDI